MPLIDRVFLSLIFLAVIVVGLFGLAAGLFVLYVVASSLFE